MVAIILYGYEAPATYHFSWSTVSRYSWLNRQSACIQVLCRILPGTQFKRISENAVHPVHQMGYYSASMRVPSDASTIVQ